MNAVTEQEYETLRQNVTKWKKEEQREPHSVESGLHERGGEKVQKWQQQRVTVK